MVWREMLCDGPTILEVGSEAFFTSRSNFLNAYYGVSPQEYQLAFPAEFQKIDPISEFDEVNLWFEYDLFCHINLLAAVAYLIQNGFRSKLYLTCSGDIPGEKQMKGLSELSTTELKAHFDSRLLLKPSDLNLAEKVWAWYCSEDHSLTPADSEDTSFTYLSKCLQAHTQRFPDARTGLNVLELQILKLIDSMEIVSEHQLCGEVLKQQGFYGYGDLQIFKIIKQLRPYFETKENLLSLNDSGHKILHDRINVFHQKKDNFTFGGTKKYDFIYHTDQQMIAPANYG